MKGMEKSSGKIVIEKVVKFYTSKKKKKKNRKNRKEKKEEKLEVC